MSASLTLDISDPLFEDANLELSQDRDILRHMLKPITKWLEFDEVEEIQINRPMEIIQRLREPLEDGSVYAFHLDRELTHDYLTNIAYAISCSLKTKNFGPEGNPVIYGDIPGGHRLVAVIGSNVQYDGVETNERGSVAFVIRQFNKSQNNSLERWGVKLGSKINKNIKSLLSRDADSDDPHVQIFNSLARGDHLLLSGATGTGKTSLLRALMQHIDQTLRVITVEDTRELVIPHRNRCHLLMQRSGQNNHFDYKAVVDLIVRMTPDIVIGGEISVANAGTIWELMRSGHGHFMTTIHAETIDEALSTFMSRIAHTAPNEVNDRDRVKAEMRKRIRVIQLERIGSKRRITAVSK
jgi:type IV secretion system protein VirB11